MSILYKCSGCKEVYPLKAGHICSQKGESKLQYDTSMLKELEDSPMTFKLFQTVAGYTAVYPNRGNNMEYPALGLAGEAGEVANKVKKIQRDYGGEITPVFRAQILKEIGDTLWYCAALATELKEDLGTIAAENLVGLADRMARDEIKGSGDER